MKKILSFFVGVLFSLTTIPATFAIPEIKGGDQVFVTNDIQDDAYLAGGMIVIDSDINGDLFVTGGSITVNGNIKGDLTVAGGNIVIKGNVGDDARIAGGNITVLGSVGDDLFVAGGTVNIDSSVAVGGSLYTGTGLLNFRGIVKEHMYIGGGNVTFGGQVGGNVDMQVNEGVVVSPAAKVQGNFTYTAPKEEPFDRSFIQGKYAYVKGSMLEEKTKGFMWSVSITLVFMFLSSFIIGLMMIFFTPYTLHNVSKEIFSKPMKSLGYGFMSFIGLVALTIISFVFVITWKIGLVLIAMLGMYVLLVSIFNGYFLAYWMMGGKKLTKGKTVLYFTGALLLYEILGIVPVIGWLFCLVLSLMSLGGIVITRKEMYAKMKKSNLL